jgi:hypothetical protein
MRHKASRHDNLFALARGSCPQFLSLRWSVVTEAIPLQATFVFGLLRYARSDKYQDGHVVFKKTPRHDNLLLDRRTAFAMTSCLYTCPQLVIANSKRVKQSVIN